MRSRRLQTLGGLAGAWRTISTTNSRQCSATRRCSGTRCLPTIRARPRFADLEEPAEYCANLTRDLLDFARQAPLALDSIDLDVFLSDLQVRLAPELGPGISFSVDVAPDTSAVEADATQLERVMTYLVLNARDAVEGRGRITMSAGPHHPNTNQVKICVEDDGVGVSIEAQERIFDPFFST